MHTGAIPPWFAPGADGKSAIMKKSGGGILSCGGSHILDLLLFLVGKPTQVYGRRFMRPGCDLDFMFHAVMDLPAGGVVHFEGNWHALKKIGYERRGWDEGFEISGTQGRLILETPVWNEPWHNAVRLRCYDNAAESWTEYETPIVNPYAEAEKAFLATVAAGAPQIEPDPFSGYRVDELIDTLWRSASENRPLSMNWQA
jgi:predicted dehydrogenase